MVAQALLGRDAVFALVFFGVTSTLVGITYYLFRFTDPAIAMAGMGISVISLLALAVLALKASK